MSSTLKIDRRALIIGSIGLVSIFLPWVSLDLGIVSFNISMFDHMTKGKDVIIIMSGLLLILGSLLFILRKESAPMMVAGVIIYSLEMINSMGSSIGPTAVSIFIRTAGIGYWIGSVAAMLSLVFLILSKIRSSNGASRIWTTTTVMAPSSPCSYPVPQTSPTAEQRAPSLKDNRCLESDDLAGPVHAKICEGDDLTQVGDHKGALACYGSALGIAQGPYERARCLMKVAWALHYLGRDEECDRFVKEACELDPRLFQEAIRLRGRTGQK